MLFYLCYMTRQRGRTDTNQAVELLLLLHVFRACNQAVSYRGAQKKGNSVASTKGFLKDIFMHTVYLQRRYQGFHVGKKSPLKTT